MDPFTQQMLERTRQRRENLAKKMAEVGPTAAPRKRRTPLAEDLSSNVVVSEKPVDDDSPNKRHCVRLVEQQIKPDTPAISSVRSRLNQLSSDCGNLDAAAESRSMDLKVASSHGQDQGPWRSRAEDKPVPATRRTRLAQLAQNINNWEDDLSHHPRPKQEDRPRRVWQPPKMVQLDSSESAQPHGSPTKPHKRDAPKPPSVPLELDAPSKPPRTFAVENDVPVKPPRSVGSCSDMQTSSASSHDRPTSPVKGVSVEPPAEETHVVSTLTIKLGSVTKGGEGQLNFTEGKTTTESPSAANRIYRGSPDDDESGHLFVKAGKTTAESPASVNRINGGMLKGQTEVAPRPSLDPSMKPVSARMAVWQQRTAATTEDQGTSKPSLARPASWEQKSTQANKEASTTSIKTAQTCVSGRSNQQPAGSPAKDEPTQQPVNSRMALWEKRVNQASKDSSVVKRPDPIARGVPPSPAALRRANSPVKSPVKRNSVLDRAEELEQRLSPVKVGPATKVIQQKLMQSQKKGWQNNDIADKLKQQKEADMAVLQNRWAHGVHNPGNQPMNPVTVVPGDVPQAPPAPPPPPPPPPGCPSPVKGTTITTTNSQSSHKPPVTQKREEARAKLRTDFENKLVAMGFAMHSVADLGHVASFDLKEQRERDKQQRQDSGVPGFASSHHTAGSSSSTSSKLTVVTTSENKSTFTSWGPTKSTRVVNPVVRETPSSTVPVAAPSRPGFSIYNLVKKQNSSESDSSSSASVARRAVPAPVSSSVANKEDSSECDSEHEDFNESEDSYQDSTSLHSTCSDSHHSETQTEGYTADETKDDTTDETEDYITDEMEEDTADETEDYPETEDYTSETVDTEDYSSEEYSDEDESEAARDIDELLDEALESEGEPPQAHSLPRQRSTVFATTIPPPPEKLATQSTQCHPPGSDYYAYQSQESRGQVTKETIRGAEKEPQYSISLYRSAKSTSKQPIPKVTIVRHSEHYHSREEEQDELPYIPEKSVKEKIKELQVLINQEQSVILQTSNALNKCCGQNSSFAGSTEQVECNRLLLIASKKREAYLSEITRLRDLRGPSQKDGPQGTLTISDIRLPLKRDFVAKIGTPNDHSVSYFICLISAGSRVIVSQMLSTHDAMVRDSLDFPNLIKLNDIKQNFRYSLDIYGMSVTRDLNQGQTPKKKKGITPKKLLPWKSSSHSSAMESPGGPNVVRTTSFTLVSSLPIHMGSLDRTHFTLDRVSYSSPLQGTIHLRLQCHMENNIEERGFLTMFEDVSGFGAWHRRWCVLKHNMLSYWKYPDQEKNKAPMGTIDLKACITDKVGLIPRDICARPHTFELATVRHMQRGDHNTLVSTCHNTVTTTKHMLSADTKEDRIAWCNKLNEALYNIRTWNPDALRPIKRS